MFNSEKPAPEELPSSAQLLRSTIIAFIAESSSWQRLSYRQSTGSIQPVQVVFSA
ncbi:MAG: hypothetical protein AAFW82_10135 [Pseudomonadota bacterium]